jgi:hypothetical protein
MGSTRTQLKKKKKGLQWKKRKKQPLNEKKVEVKKREGKRPN